MSSTSDNYIRFLGTAGSRWVVAAQTRASGGIYLHLNGQRVLMDPGPGSLVRCADSTPRIDPTQLDGLVLTHGHIDHSGDVNVMIDAMTGGGIQRGGSLHAPGSCIEGEDAVLLRYLKPFLGEVRAIEAGGAYSIGSLRFMASQPHQHGLETYGIIYEVGEHRIGFLLDTRYFDGLADSYVGVDTLVLYVTFVDSPPHPVIKHLCVDDARTLIDQIKPKTAILTHFGRSMLDAGPESIAAQLADDCGVEVIAATDGMVFPVGDGTP